MTKLLILFPMALIIGCSSASKKTAPETKPNSESASTPTSKETPAAPVESKKTKVKEKAAASTAAEVTCSVGSEVRKLVIKSKGQGCELEYTKGGQTSAIASQISGQAKCEEVSTRIQDKLIAAGYSCQ